LGSTTAAGILTAGTGAAAAAASASARLLRDGPESSMLTVVIENGLISLN